MNTLSSRRWNTYTIPAQIDFIARKFCSPEFTKQFGIQLPSLPGMKTIVMLRSLRVATIEVLEILDHSTLYRLRQTGQVILVSEEYTEKIYQSYEEYNQERPAGKAILKLPTREIVYTLDPSLGYEKIIHRHKYPRFTGTIIITPNQTLDGHPNNHIDITNIKWFSPDPLTPAQINSLVKKTILFVKSNYFRAKEEQPTKMASE